MIKLTGVAVSRAPAPATAPATAPAPAPALAAALAPAPAHIKISTALGAVDTVRDKHLQLWQL